MYSELSQRRVRAKDACMATGVGFSVACQRGDALSVFDARIEQALEPRRNAAQVDGAAAVNMDEAGLRALRLLDVADRHDVDVRASGVRRLRVVHRQLAGIDDGIGRRIVTARSMTRCGIRA